MNDVLYAHKTTKMTSKWYQRDLSKRLTFVYSLYLIDFQHFPNGLQNYQKKNLKS